MHLNLLNGNIRKKHVRSQVEHTNSTQAGLKVRIKPGTLALEGSCSTCYLYHRVSLCHPNSISFLNSSSLYLVPISRHPC